jgi:hypothetical protein
MKFGHFGVPKTTLTDFMAVYFCFLTEILEKGEWKPPGRHYDFLKKISEEEMKRRGEKTNGNYFSSSFPYLVFSCYLLSCRVEQWG